MKKFMAMGLTAGALFAVSLFGAHDAKAESRIADNVEIGKVDVSGMTSKEAENAISEYVAEAAKKQITLATEDQKITVSASDLGFSADSGDSVESAIKYGRKGNLIERYKSVKDIEAGEKKCLSLSTKADESKIRDFLKKNECKLVTEPVDGSLKRENGEFSYVAGKAGHRLDMDASVAAVMNYVSSGKYDKTDTVKLVTKTKKPKGTKEELSKVKDVLGKFSTSFATSTSARAQNVRNGASKINGTILYPGDKFSVAKALNPMTAENGYAPAPSYENGTTVDTYGGGICQVSTTLYNAVIRSELKVLERSAHSMMVHYVEPSDDAAIAGFYKDFKFQNSTKYPVYIEGIASGGVITFTVYGKETRDPSRTVEFQTERLDTIPKKTKITADPSQPVGTVTKTSDGKDGLKARLWKIVKVNGKEESRTVFNNSRYAATDEQYTVGTMSDSADAVSAMKAAIASGNIDTVKAAAAQWKDAGKQDTDDTDSKDTDSGDKNTDSKNADSKNTDKQGADSQNATQKSTGDSSASNQNSKDNGNKNTKPAASNNTKTGQNS
ncbi:MAG: hypothetical protein DUD27_03655 [Lachnospiraceae bacterium]|nr:MAG: hypothetical protein DUD27_03655 [Lachnospiraceae bacterium]